MISSSRVLSKAAEIWNKVFHVKPVFISIIHFKFGKIYLGDLISYLELSSNTEIIFYYSMFLLKGAILLLVNESWVKYFNYKPNWKTWFQFDIRLSSIDRILKLVRILDK